MSMDKQQSAKEDTAKPQPQHDPFFRSTFGEPELFRKWFVWFLPVMSELLNLDRLEMQKDSLIDEQLKAHYSDLIYKIPIRDTDKNMVVFVLVEHKTTSERWTMLQIMRYIVLIWLRELNATIEQKRLVGFVLPPILPIIVYHGERPFTAPTRFAELVYPFKGYEKHSPDFESMLFDLTRTHESDLPEDLELYAVLSIMQAVFRPDVADRVMRIYEKIKHKLSNSHYRNRWLKLLRYMMSSSKYISLEDFREVTNQMSDTDVVTISPLYRELLAEGEAVGFEKGIEKGIETLLRILAKRLGDVPLTIRDKLLAIHDLDMLGQLTDAALDSKSLDDFEAALGK